jgi:hypothetical protein
MQQVYFSRLMRVWVKAVLRIRIHRIHVFLGHLDPDPDILVGGLVSGYLPLGGAGDANISARQTSHLSGPYFQFVMRSGIIFSDQKT